MESQSVNDIAAAGRRARFGTLPERVRYEDLVEEKMSAPRDPTRDAFHAEGAWSTFSCLAVDLGL
ncbi:hypothetical protein [Streptomyces sp. NPDC051452]|uniref:hypothetical protein n=1 Tax=Streptomyces sp. NPDC051452 TaxID=3365654 RepID=UPI0037A40E56